MYVCTRVNLIFQAAARIRRLLLDACAAYLKLKILFLIYVYHGNKVK